MRNAAMIAEYNRMVEILEPMIDGPLRDDMIRAFDKFPEWFLREMRSGK